MGGESRNKTVSTRLTASQAAALQQLAGEKEVSTYLADLIRERLELERLVGESNSPDPDPFPPPTVPPPTPPPAPPPPKDDDPDIQVPDVIMRPSVEHTDRRASRRWPSARPLGVMGACAVAVLAMVAAWHIQVNYRWSETQRMRWPAYVKSGVYAELGLPPASYAFLKAGRYQHSTVHDYLRQSVYDGHTLIGVWRDPATVGFLVLAVGLVFGARRDWRAHVIRRDGRVVKGPELVDAATFRTRVRGDGVAVEQSRGPAVAIPMQAEPMHISVSGGTGSGKSTLIRQWLRQIAARGETAVVYDPAGEFVRQFYDATRGDVILNPFDSRFPGWAIGQEVDTDAEAMAVAAALFTSRKHGDEFFREVPRRIFAHLLTRTPRPTAAELRHWLADADLLDAVLTSSENGRHHAAMLPKAAYHQHGGIMAELNLVGDALSTLTPEGPASWSAARWSRNRTGWVFVTSAPATRERQLPLMTLWLDLLMLRVMQKRGTRRTWIVIDELASIGRLPQLPTALTEARKFDVAIVLGFQSTSQLEALYGPVWRAMVAAPATHIVLRTTEPESAKWEAALLGEVQRERIKETNTKTGRKWSRSEAVERTTEPLVMASQIGGLPPLEGFLKYENSVARIRFPYQC